MAGPRRRNYDALHPPRGKDHGRGRRRTTGEASDNEVVEKESAESRKRRPRHEIWDLEDKLALHLETISNLEQENQALKRRLEFMQTTVRVRESQVERLKQFGVSESAPGSRLLQRNSFSNGSAAGAAPTVGTCPQAANHSSAGASPDVQGSSSGSGPSSCATQPQPSMCSGPEQSRASSEADTHVLNNSNTSSQMASHAHLDPQPHLTTFAEMAQNVHMDLHSQLDFHAHLESLAQLAPQHHPDLPCQAGTAAQLQPDFQSHLAPLQQAVHTQVASHTQTTSAGATCRSSFTASMGVSGLTSSISSGIDVLGLLGMATQNKDVAASGQQVAMEVAVWSESQIIDMYKQTSTELSQLLFVAEDTESPEAVAAMAQLEIIVATIRHLGAIAKVCNPAIVRVVSQPVSAGISPATDDHWESVATALLLNPQQIEDVVMLNDLRLKWLNKIQQEHVVVSSTLTEVLKEIGTQWKVAWDQGQVQKAEMMNKLQRVIGAERWVLVLVDELLVEAVLDTMQVARCLVHSYPYVPDACAVVDAVARLQRRRKAAAEAANAGVHPSARGTTPVY